MSSISLLMLLICTGTQVGFVSAETTTITGVTQPDYWPTDGWQSTTPEEQDVDSARLSQMTEYIDSESPAIDSIVIIRHGYVVYEEYPTLLYNENRTHYLYSVTKSFTSCAIGMAIDKGYIDNTSLKMLSFFPDYVIEEPDERRDRVTIENLLMMKSGIFWDESSAPFSSPDNGIYHINTGDGVEYVLNLPMASEPGTEWHYNTGASHVLSAIVQRATGNRTSDFVQQHLFEPLGIEEFTWWSDIAGYTKGGFDLKLRSHDTAKFGFLYLHNGSWDGLQVISSDWVNESTSTLTELYQNRGYGYQWWTFPHDGVYDAAGLYGQRIFVCPDYDLVVTMTASMIRQESDVEYELLTQYIIPSIAGHENDFAWMQGILLAGGAGILLVAVALLVARHRR